MKFKVWLLSHAHSKTAAACQPQDLGEDTA